MALFTATRFEIGTASSAQIIALEPMSKVAADFLGPACAAMDPWRRYGISAEQLTASFQPELAKGTYRYQIRVGDQLAGVAMFMHPWLVGPYLQFIAVLPSYQGAGVGRAVLAWFEDRARQAGQRNIWLCVTSFNAAARGFYRNGGWEEAGVLPDLLRPGIDEHLLRKRLVRDLDLG